MLTRVATPEVNRTCALVILLKRDSSCSCRFQHGNYIISFADIRRERSTTLLN